jgi:hypothetical protein
LTPGYHSPYFSEVTRYFIRSLLVIGLMLPYRTTGSFTRRSDILWIQWSARMRRYVISMPVFFAGRNHTL